MKDIFKRLTAKLAKSKPIQNAPAKPHKIPNKTNTIALAAIGILVLLLAGAYFVFEAEISSTYQSIAQYFGDAPPAQTQPAAAPHTISLAQSAPLAVSAIIASSSVEVIASSSVDATSAVSTASMVADASAASDVSQATTESVVAQSGITSFDTAFASAPSDTSQPTSGESSVRPPTQRATATRPHNRDVRHCLSLKTNEAIARCVYPK